MPGRFLILRVLLCQYNGKDALNNPDARKVSIDPLELAYWHEFCYYLHGQQLYLPTYLAHACWDDFVITCTVSTDPLKRAY
eukprot:3821562-Pyramimonas_sp.AAC.1